MYKSIGELFVVFRRVISLRLFGSFAAHWCDGEEIIVRSSKIRALLALLVLAPEGRRTRAWLQDMLWSLSGPEHGRASLRRGLSDLRQIFGDRFHELFETSNIDIRIKKEHIDLVGDESDGLLLEGISVREVGFERWLKSKRQIDHKQMSLTSMGSGKGQVRPSVAIIPFLMVSGSHDESYLGDMIAQEVTRSLSRSQIFDVISHLSCRRFDVRSLGLNDIKSTLGTNYVIYGNFRTDSGKFRLDADFVETERGRILWTREYSGSIAEFCTVEAEVASALATQIAQSIVTSSIELACACPLPSVSSHALFMSGAMLMHRQTLSSFSKARAQIEEVIRRAPDYSFLHAWLAKWYVLSVQQGWSTDIAKDTFLASDCVQRALDLNPQCSFSLTVDGFVQNNLLKQFDNSSVRFQQALDVDPNNALAWLLKGTLLAFMDQGEKAITFTERARSLSPLDPHKYFFDSLSATACLANRDYHSALELAELSLQANRRHTSTLRVRTIALQSMGKYDEAAKSAEELLRREPSLTIERYLEKHPAAKFQTGKEWALALKEAGVPAQ